MARPFDTGSLAFTGEAAPVAEKILMPALGTAIGVFSASQKQEMVRKLTDAMVSIEGENMRKVTWVVVEEVKTGDWGIGGTPITTAGRRP